MSFKSELEELVKWISELSESKEAEPTPEPLHREDWQAVDGTLQRASIKFGEARLALLAENPPRSFLAEFARDLEREAEGLALRAHLLSRRAAPKPMPDPEKTRERVPPAPPAAATGAQPGGEEQVPRDPKKPAEPPAPQSPADLVKSAGGTVETAHNKLEVVKHPDSVSKAFEEELDVLAEMTLSLRQQCERLDDEPAHVEARR